MRPKPLVVAIDGPSGTGKSTVAKQLAKRLGLFYLNTGAMYRAVAWAALRKGIAWNDVDALARLASRCRIAFRKDPTGRVRIYLNGVDVTVALNRPEVSEAASRLAEIKEIRQILVRKQRRLGRRGVVAEGRDTTTVVFPDADVKFYMTASLWERARRRHRQLRLAGIRVGFQEVLDSVRTRDRRDRERSASPLRPASGAIRIDTTRLKPKETYAIMMDYVRRRAFPESLHRRTGETLRRELQASARRAARQG